MEGMWLWWWWLAIFLFKLLCILRFRRPVLCHLRNWPTPQHGPRRLRETGPQEPEQGLDHHCLVLHVHRHRLHSFRARVVHCAQRHPDSESFRSWAHVCAAAWPVAQLHCRPSAGGWAVDPHLCCPAVRPWVRLQYLLLRAPHQNQSHRANLQEEWTLDQATQLDQPLISDRHTCSVRSHTVCSCRRQPGPVGPEGHRSLPDGERRTIDLQHSAIWPRLGAVLHNFLGYFMHVVRYKDAQNTSEL